MLDKLNPKFQIPSSNVYIILKINVLKKNPKFKGEIEQVVRISTFFSL